MIRNSVPKILLALMSAALIAMSGAVPVGAQGNQPKVTSLGELERLYPMTPEAEAAIVHKIPPAPVIVDGVKYQAAEIAQFNGRRLRFADVGDGQLYAFTTVKGLEDFLSERRAKYFANGGTLASTDELWVNTLFSLPGFVGSHIFLASGIGVPDLGAMDNHVESVWNYTGYETTIFDYVNYGGDWYTMYVPGGPPLWQYSTMPWGWNNRAESAFALPY